MPEPASPRIESSSRQIFVLWLGIPLIILLGIALFVQPEQSGGPQHPAVGKPAPEIDLVRLGANPELDRLQSLASGDVTLVHFWGTWCGPCKMEYPELDAMVQQLKDQPQFHFVSISCQASQNETYTGLTEKTLAYLESGGMVPVAYADAMGVTHRSVAQRMEVESISYPTSILVDADGKIADIWIGYAPQSVEDIAAKINILLADAR